MAFITCLLAFVLLPFSSAHAYIDPGTGSMILQALLAGVAGVGVLAKMYWHRIISVFRTPALNTEQDTNDNKQRTANE